MAFILRWPAILVLLLLVVISIGAAFAGTVQLAQLPIALPTTAEQQATIAQVSWIEVGLWTGAGLFFLICAVRLIRRTQGFWTWLIGFALYGSRWAVAQQNEDGGLVASVRGIDLGAYVRQPQLMLSDPGSPAAQVALLGVVVIIGILIFIVDAVDRAYWDKQGA